MDETKDPLLSNFKRIELPTSRESILDLGYLVISMPREDLEKIGKIFNYIFESNDLARCGSTFLKGAIFAIGSREYGNKEWREHCASSLRELFHEWRDAGRISTAFNNIFKSHNSKFPNMTTHIQDYRSFQEYYGYFSDICHHNANNTVIHLRNIYDDSDIQIGDNTPEMFLKTVEKFLGKIKLFFDTHIKNLNIDRS